MTPVSLTAEQRVSLMTGFLAPLTQTDAREEKQVFISTQLPQRGGGGVKPHMHFSYVTMLFLHIRHRYSLFDTRTDPICPFRLATVAQLRVRGFLTVAGVWFAVNRLAVKPGPGF